MLFAGWEVSMVKNCDRGLENVVRGASFSPHGPTFNQPANNMFIFFSCSKLALQITNGLFTHLLSFNGLARVLARRHPTICNKILATNE